MAVTVLDDETFTDALAGADMAVVDFYAGWCGPCIMFKPKYRRISNDYPHVVFFMVDGEKSPVARKSVQIDNLPYFGFYRNGELVHGESLSKEDAFRAAVVGQFGEAP